MAETKWTPGPWLAQSAFEAAGWHRSPSGWKREPDLDAVREFKEAAE